MLLADTQFENIGSRRITEEVSQAWETHQWTAVNQPRPQLRRVCTICS